MKNFSCKSGKAYPPTRDAKSVSPWMNALFLLRRIPLRRRNVIYHGCKAVELHFFNALLFLAVFGLSGCATMNNLDELLVLKSVADNQKDIESYLKQQEDGFKKLLDDVKNNRLKRGLTKKYIIATYAEPVLAKDDTKDPSVREILLYRHPTQYFNSDRIYLYLDNDYRLIFWELKPANS